MYEWDDDKQSTNRLKHRMGFERVDEFEWRSAVIEEDLRFDYGERRFRAFGFIAGKPHCLVFTPRGRNLRIISLRPMHQKEARRYGL